MNGGGGGTQTALTLTRPQKQIQEAFGAYLTPRLGEGLPAYTGPQYEPLSPEQIAQWEQAGTALRGVAPTVAQAYQTALTGQVTPGFGAGEIDRYLQAQRAAETRTFEEETIPGIREAYRGPGTYWGGVRAKAEERARTTFETEQAAREAQLRLGAREFGVGLEERARERQLLAGAGYGTAFQNAILGAMAPGEVLRRDIQMQYDVDFQNWIRAMPEFSPVIQQALQFLGIPMMAIGFQQPEGGLGGAISGGLSGAASGGALGSMFGPFGAATGAGLGGIAGLFGGM